MKQGHRKFLCSVIIESSYPDWSTSSYYTYNTDASLREYDMYIKLISGKCSHSLPREINRKGRFSGIFRGYEMGVVAKNGLNYSSFIRFK